MQAAELTELYKKLDELVARNRKDKPEFTESEVESLRRVLAFVKRLDALGWWGKWAFYGLLTIGAILVNWDRIKDTFN